jgi:predicted nucleic-acid-binding protein
MIAFDTNVLVRFLVEDDEKQSRQATRLIEGALQRDEPIFLSDIVMCETVWVLSTSYRFPRSEIAGVLSNLIRGRGVVFTSSDSLARALRAYDDGKGEFADYLIREHARTAGADTVATFDRAFLNHEGFSRP